MAAIETTWRDALATAVAAIMPDATVTPTFRAFPDVSALSKGRDHVFVYPVSRRTEGYTRVDRQVSLEFGVKVIRKLPLGAVRDNDIDAALTAMDELEERLALSADIPFAEFADGGGGRETYDLEALENQNAFVATLSPVLVFYVSADG